MNPHFLLKDEQQIRAVESIRRVDKDGYLYYMESSWNYYHLDEPFASMLDAGCSTFVSRNTENEFLMYRNYDYPHYLGNDKSTPLTGINVICRNTNPEAKYKSIGVADAYWLDFKNGSLGNGCADDGKTDLSAFAMIPYICMDGVNEAGLAVSIMALNVKADWIEIDYDSYQDKLDPKKANYELKQAGEVPDIWAKRNEIGSIAYNTADKKAWICQKEWVQTTLPGRKAVLHPVLMRMMLDNCANVPEALNLAGMFNVKAPAPAMDFHVLVTDASGSCKLLEWIDNKMNIVDTYHSTNFRFSQDDDFHGVCPRDQVLKAGLGIGEQYGLRQDLGEMVLHLAAQDPSIGKNIGKTQYSCVYNLQQKTVKVFSFGDFEHSWTFKL